MQNNRVEVEVISRSRRLRLIPVTLTETSIILDITKTKLIIVLLYIERKKLMSCFCLFTDGEQHKSANLTWLPLEIMHRGHTLHDYSWPWVSLTWLLYNLQLWRHEHRFRKFTVPFRPIGKEIASSMYNNQNNMLRQCCVMSKFTRSSI